MQLGILSYVCTYNPPACNCYVAQACTCNQTHVQMKHSLAHLQDLIPTLAGIKHIINNTSQSRD